MSLHRRQFLCLSGAMAVAMAAPVRAGRYPERQVRFIVPYSPGANPDLAARIVAQSLAAGTGQPFVIETRTGAAGAIGLRAAAQAAPDGYTIVMGHVSGLSINPTIYRELPYDPLKDFIPIAQVYRAPLVLLVSARAPYRSLDELIADARERPGTLTFSSGGNGTGAHLTGEALARFAGTDIRHIPYSSVSGALTAVAGGEVTFSFGNLSLGMPLVQGGKLRALALSGSERPPGYPDVPPVQASLADFDFYDWSGVLAPAGTPPAIVAELESRVAAALKEPQVAQQLQAQGLGPVDVPSEAFRAFIAEQQERWGKVARSIGLQLD